jgi:hypothetical protein
VICYLYRSTFTKHYHFVWLINNLSRHKWGLDGNGACERDDAMEGVGVKGEKPNPGLLGVKFMSFLELQTWPPWLSVLVLFI